MKALCSHFPLRQPVAVLLITAVSIGLASCHKTDPDVRKILQAARGGDLQELSLLVNKNPNLVLRKGREGFTALHYAAFYGYIEIVNLLLARNADVNAKTDAGDTPLDYAASRGYKDIVELLLTNKASVDARNRAGCTPLYYAATNGRIEEVRILLAAKANVNAKTVRGYSVLTGAASYGRDDIVRLLIDNGANVNAADFDGGTPVYWARIRGYYRTQDFLRQHGGVELPSARPEWPYP
jgi:ankyrin repeat protein